MEDQGGDFHPSSLKETQRMDERETQGGGMPVAYIHVFAYFFFREGKMQFTPGVVECGGLRKGDGKQWVKCNGAPT